MNEVLQWPLQLRVPAANLLELLDTEFKEEQPQLLFEISYERVVAVQQVELEPEGHDFVVKVRARLDELDVEVLWSMALGRGG